METLTHWKKLQNPDYLGSWAFLPKEEKTVTITKVYNKDCKTLGGKTETQTLIEFDELEKPLMLNVINSQRITKLYKSPHVENWIGKKIILSVDPTVKFAGEVVGGVRVKPVLPNAKKKQITPANFTKALAAVKAGKYTKEKVVAAYELTEEQVAQL